MRHVGDVDPQSPATSRQHFQGQRIVEVTGVRRIDRDDRHRGEILAITKLGIVETLGRRPSRLENLLGKLARQPELVDHRL